MSGGSWSVLTNAFLAGIAGIAGTGCSGSSPDSCPFHCWESFLAAEDLPEDPVYSGYYPQQCTQAGGVGSILVPLPDLGYAARECYPGTLQHGWPDTGENSEAHSLLQLAIAKDQENAMLTQDEEDAYARWIASIDGEARESCVNHLTCNQAPGTCDIDPGVAGDQSCTVTSAQSLCTLHVSDVLEGQLSLPGPERYPEYSGVSYFSSLEEYCEGHIPKINGTGGGAVSSGDGVSPGTAGADSTDTGAAPFGDPEDLILCEGTSCEIDVRRVLEIKRDFSRFYDAGVRLEGVDGSTPCGPGVRVSGLFAEATATDWLDEFSVDNGDILTEVNGIRLSSEDAYVAALHDLANDTEFEVVIKRSHGPKCSSTTWMLTIVVTE